MIEVLGGLHHVEQVMGMAVSLDVRGTEANPEAVRAVVAWLHHVDETFSTHKVQSPISTLGRGEMTLEDVSEEIREVLRLCEVVRSETNGAFDVFEVRAPNGTHLDPSGLVKGWAIERAAAILEDFGCSNFCINAGGDIALRGTPTTGNEWRVGIRHPDDREALALVIEGHGRLAIATSATYERGAHIIDPSTAQPTAELASVTIVGSDLTMADAYATAVFVMGFDGLDWIEAVPGYEAFLIDHDHRTYRSSRFDEAHS